MKCSRLAMSLAVMIFITDGSAQTSRSTSNNPASLVGKWSTGSLETGFLDLFLSEGGSATIKIHGSKTIGDCGCEPMTVVTAKWKAQSGTLKLSEWFLGKSESGGRLLNTGGSMNPDAVLSASNYCRTLGCDGWSAEMKGRYFGIQNSDADVSYTIAGDYLLWKGFEFKRQ